MITPVELLDMLITGILLGGLYALLTLGLTLIFGVMEIINVSHGALIMIGAYTSYWVHVFTGGLVNPLVSILASAPVGFLLGMGLYRALLVRVVGEPPLTSLLLMFGLSTFVTNTALLVWKALYRGIPFSMPVLRLGEVTVPLTYLTAFFFALGVMFILYIILMRTYIGKAIRAVAQNREIAPLMGIDVDFVSMVACGLAVMITTVAGSLLIIISPTIYPEMGAHWQPLAFCIAVLGGMGSEKGTLAAGFIIGVVEVLATRLFVPAILSPAVAFVILILILLIRPTGLFGGR